MAMTREQMGQAAGLEPGWELNRTGADRPDGVLHLCERLYNLLGTYESAWVRLPYRPAMTPGIEVAQCERCRATSVRSTALHSPRPARRRRYP